MAQKFFLPGDTGLQVRTVIDDNFTELYSWTEGKLIISGYRNTFADLPPFADHSGEFWWVLTGTGSTLTFNRKDAGMYRSDGTKWVFSSVKVEYYLSDDSFILSDNLDDTKQMRFELDNISSGATRVLTVGDLDGELIVGAGAVINYPAYTLTTNAVRLDLTYAGTPVTGELYWSTDNKTASLQMEDGGAIELGQELGDYYTNLSGTTLVNGDVVSAIGASGNRTAVTLTDASDGVLASACTGMVTVPSINDNQVGRVTTKGKVRDLNTSGLTEGLPVYVDPLNPGKLTQTPPNTPNSFIHVGIVLTEHSTQGVIDVDIQVSPKLVDLSDVNGTPLTTTGQIAVWNQTNGYFDFDYNINDYALEADLPTSYLAIDGSNANQNIDIGANGFSAGSLSVGNDLSVGNTIFVDNNSVGNKAFFGDVDLNDRATIYFNSGENRSAFYHYNGSGFGETWIGHPTDVRYSLKVDGNTGDVRIGGEVTTVGSGSFGEGIEATTNASDGGFIKMTSAAGSYMIPFFLGKSESTAFGQYFLSTPTSTTQNGFTNGAFYYNARSDAGDLLTTGSLAEYANDGVTKFKIDITGDAQASSFSTPTGTSTNIALLDGTIGDLSDGSLDLDVNSLAVSDNTYNPLIVNRDGSTPNVGIEFQHNGINSHYLSLYSTNDLRWGTSANAANNNLIYHSGNSNSLTNSWVANNMVANSFSTPTGTSTTLATMDGGFVDYSDGSLSTYFDAVQGDTASFGNVSGGNYTSIEADGTIKFNGDATVFDDESRDITGIEVTGTGVSINSTELTVDFTSTSQLNDYAYTNFQFSHSRKLDSNIYPHIHWIQEENNTPNFLIQYRWQVNGQPKVTTWTNYIVNTNAFTYASGSLNQISYGAGIAAPATDGISSILQVRVIRDTDNDSTEFTGADAYTGTVGITEVDVHYEIDTVGSREQYVK